MTDIQWLRIRSCPNTCSGLYVDNEARGRPLFVLLLAPSVRKKALAALV